MGGWGELAQLLLEQGGGGDLHLLSIMGWRVSS